MKHLIPVLFICSTVLAQAVTIVIDYSYDYGYFQSGSAARATMEEAAANLSARLVDGQLAAVPTRTATGTATVNTGVFDLTTTANLTASYSINHPSSGGFTRLAQETFAADEVRIYVGMLQFSMTSTLVEGMPNGVEITTLAYGNLPSWQAAIDLAAANATALFQRGSAVRIATIDGSIPFNGNTSVGQFQLGIGATGGSLWFKPGMDWQYDNTQDVGETQNDLYSHALHEMIEILGADVSDEAIAAGQRVDLNDYQLQALRNAGWMTTQIPEPSALFLSLLSLPLLLKRNRA